MSAIGSVLAGKYRIVARIGEGGMGCVYHAENVITGKQVALKQMHSQLAANPTSVARFVREARAASRLSHPNVLDIYDIVQSEAAPFLVMELLQGETLRAYLQRNPYLEVSEYLALMLPALAGVAAAHASGVIHRDLKPDNIFLARGSGRSGTLVKVVDFGIAQLATRDDARLTEVGAALGTPEYMSVEQLRGQDVDARTDVYAFGVMLYEAIAGQPPHRAATLPELIIKVATTDAPRLSSLRPDLPARLASAIDRALARDREQRWHELGSLSDELERFTHDESYEGRAVPRLGKVGPAVADVARPRDALPETPAPLDTFGARELAPRRRNTGLWAAGVAACALLASIAWGAHGIWSSFSSGQQAQVPPPIPTLTQEQIFGPSLIRTGVCLIDANDDGLLDLVGSSGFGNNGPAMILDGRDGKKLWSGGSYDVNTQVFCPTRDQFVINEANSFLVTLHDSRKPEPARTIRLSDKPEAWGFGPGCMAILTADEKRHELSLRDGAPMQCKVETDAYVNLAVSAYHSASADPTPIVRGKDRFRVDARTPGTPVLTASAQGQHTWKIELAYQNNDPRHVLVGDVLATLGQPVDGSKKGYRLVGLDAATGGIRYEQPLCARTSAIMSMTANGPNIVIVEGGTGVSTFDAKTGRLIWRHGTC